MKTLLNDEALRQGKPDPNDVAFPLITEQQDFVVGQEARFRVRNATVVNVHDPQGLGIDRRDPMPLEDALGY